MTSRPSPAFRRLCLAMAGLALIAPLAQTGHAALSPLEAVKLQLKKPNIIFVIESAQSMQGLPGESASRFNEVGADCQDGDRFCRLMGQAGRCDITGMGLHGDGTAASATVPDTSACTLNSQCQGQGSCYMDPSTPCSTDADCAVASRTSSMKGDFCQRRSNSTCVSSSTVKTCELQKLDCSSNASVCNLATDACLNGAAGSICRVAGTWCKTNSDCASGDECVPATSRFMMAKNAVRRVILENSQIGSNINFGLMHTFQAAAANLFPYLKLQEASPATRTEDKFLPRTELLKGTYNSGPCFSESGGPTPSCTIDYGGGGAITSDTPAPYSITYSLRSNNNSRYAVPTGTVNFVRVGTDMSWGTGGCNMLCPFPSASTPGNGIYEGSYYTFQYKIGTPVTSGDGSRNQPHYYPYYRGKSFYDGTSWWVHVDAERTEFVNGGLYGQKPFTGTATSTSTYTVPWSGGTATGAMTSTSCSTSIGGQWDKNVVPLVNAPTFQGPGAASAVTISDAQKGLMNVARLEKASFGGMYPAGNLAPLACLLKNQAAADAEHSLTDYMSAAASQDTAYYGSGNGTCDQFRKERNHVILIVDGMPRGPGDDTHGGTIDCSATACNLTSTPSLAGCNCPVVLRAHDLAVAGTSVHVIVASSDLASRNTYAAQTLNNLAQAGSAITGITNQPRYATNEDQIYAAINTEMSQALRQQVAGSEASSSSAAQGDGSVEASHMLLHAYSELPEWKGHVLGVAVTTSTATKTATATTTSGATATTTASTVVASTGVSWEASTWLNDPANWCRRRVYFSDDAAAVAKVNLTNTGSTCSTAVVDSATLTKLQSLGMGANTAETNRIVRWMLGDPAYPNPAILGSVTNSVPIDVGPPGYGELPGAKNFMKLYSHRPNLVYVGADDGMLHAFHTSDGAAWSAGQEAFAFLPRDMIPIVNRLYAQGGQRYSPDDHIFGLAGSPKVKNICVTNCSVTTGCPCESGSACPDTGSVQSGCPVWKTALVMTAGPGGNHPFVLDVTDVVNPASVSVDTGTLLNWHAGYGSNTSKSLWESYLGETDSVPGFFFNNDSTKSDYRVIMTSGYPYADRTNTATSTSTSTSTSQGRTLVVARAMGTDAASKGAVVDSYSVAAPTCSSVPAAHKYALLGDVAVAKDYTRVTSSGPQDLGLIGAYFGDTWGDLHQYAPGYTPKVDAAGSGFPLHLGCGHPLYHPPAVVQLNRFDSSFTTDFFLVQVTNSVRDPFTRPLDATNFPESKMSVVRIRDGSPPQVDTSFGTSGLITLTAGRTDAFGICGVTTAGKSSSATSCGSGGSFLPGSARPTTSPNAIIRSDGAGFQVITIWYVAPAANWDTCPSSATDGSSYIVLHEFLSGGGWTQIFGQQIPHEMVTGVQFVGTNMFYSTADAGGGDSEPTPIAGAFGQSFKSALSKSGSGTGERFTKTAWIDRID